MAALALPDQSVPVVTVRHLPAARRLRIDVPGIHFDRKRARELERVIAALPGVRRVRADPTSGRLLVTYDRAAPASLFAEPPAPPPTVPERAAALWRQARGLAGRFVRRRAAGPRAAVGDAHALRADEVLAALGVAAETGLTAEEAARRLTRLGANAVEGGAPRSVARIVAGQLANLPTVLLIGSAGVSLLLGDFLDAALIALVVAINAAIGYRIERKNEQLLASWARLQAGHAEVVRDGQVLRISAVDLVPGDVLLVRSGDVVPADVRVLASSRLTSDEAALTGESEPATKAAAPVPAAAPLAERSSMLHAGTIVASGHARAVVVATGAATELARVRALVESTKQPVTPLERELSRLGRISSGIGIGAAFAASGLGLLRAAPLGLVVRRAVALGVAAIPEGLPVVATAALVRAMSRMRDQGVYVRRIVSAETLGGVTVVCADKTGTLTQNDMRVEVLELPDGAVDLAAAHAHADDPFADALSLALLACVLNSEVEIHENGSGRTLSGSSTEKALVRAAAAAGLDPAAIKATWPRRALRERRDGVNYVVSVHAAPDGGCADFVKGAPEQVVELCALDDAGRARVLARNRALAGDGLRVLALAARRRAADTPVPDGFDYRYLGLVALRDPLRPGAADAISAARRAGIRTLILTGDQRATAAAVARAVGIEGDAVDGNELLAELARDPAAARARLARIGVVSRVAPAEKVAIVRALREAGEIVAMAGDGVNDAPALKSAHIGIAVGARASDLARQTADVVLEREDLRSILAVVAEGRVVRENLRHAMRFLFATNLSEVVLALGGTLVARHPLTAMQLLWINLITDTAPALALALEPARDDVLARPPMAHARLFERDDARKVVRDGLILSGASAAAWAAGGVAAGFPGLIGAQLGYAALCRAPDAPIDGRFVGMLGAGAALQVLAFGVPALRTLLQLPAPGLLPFVALAGAMAIPLVIGGVT